MVRLSPPPFFLTLAKRFVSVRNIQSSAGEGPVLPGVLWGSRHAGFPRCPLCRKRRGLVEHGLACGLAWR